MRCAVSAVSAAFTPDIQVMPLPHAQDVTPGRVRAQENDDMKIADQVLTVC
jgi:hypothetical protein